MRTSDRSFAMWLSFKFASWCAAVALGAVLVVSRPCMAQPVKAEAEAEHAANVAAHEAAEAEHGGAGEATAGPNPLAVDPDLAIWTLVVFVILFLVLKT